MSKGFPPNTAEHNRLNGNASRRPTDFDNMSLESGIPECPEWVGPVARKQWYLIAEPLARAGVLKLAHSTALELLVERYAEWRRMLQAIQDSPTYEVEVKEGVYVRRAKPEVAMAENAFKAVKAMLEQFGLTPASHSRVRIPLVNPNGDPFDDLLSGKTNGN